MSYFHPQRMPALPARRRAAARRQLEELVATSSVSGRRRRRIRHPAAITAAMAVIMLGTGAAAVITFGPVTNHAIMRCYSAARSSPSYYRTVAQPGGATTRAGIRHATGICRDLFKEGFLTLGAKVRPPSRPLVRHHVPPHLVLCVQDDGAAAVVPGRGAEICEQVGLKAAARQ